jgi:hypothetical protein
MPPALAFILGGKESSIVNATATRPGCWPRLARALSRGGVEGAHAPAGRSRGGGGGGVDNQGRGAARSSPEGSARLPRAGAAHGGWKIGRLCCRCMASRGGEGHAPLVRAGQKVLLAGQMVLCARRMFFTRARDEWQHTQGRQCHARDRWCLTARMHAGQMARQGNSRDLGACRHATWSGAGGWRVQWLACLQLGRSQRSCRTIDRRCGQHD